MNIEKIYNNNMNLPSKILSDIVVFMKYARHLSKLQRRETWEEIVTRNKEMHIRKFPNLKDEIEQAYEFVYDKKVTPSMRSLQFGGKPIELSPNRIFNCAYLPIDDVRAFSEIMFLLLGGSGVGYSVQAHHIEQLPEIRKPDPDKYKRFLVADSIEGWAEAIRALISSYVRGKHTINFDFRDIREKGAKLITSGGKAPGPEPLRKCIERITKILNRKNDGEKLSSIEIHDIICHIADAVLAGGIRRAALISLFNADDDMLLSAKSSNVPTEIISREYVKYIDGIGLRTNENEMSLTLIQDGVRYEDVRVRRDKLSGKFWDLEQYDNDKTLGWWVVNPQRGRANNSAVLLRRKITKDFFLNLWKKIEDSKSGEPGIFFTNDKDYGTNPCVVGSTKVLTNKGFIEIKRLTSIYKKYPDIKIITQDSERRLNSSELKWCGITQSNDNIYRINFSNGAFQLTNLKHKFYLENYEEITVSSIIEKCKNEDVYVRSYSGLVKVQDVINLEYTEDVYDLTAEPNFNFFARYDCEETFSDSIVSVNDVNYYPFDVVLSNNGSIFVKDLTENDEIYL